MTNNRLLQVTSLVCALLFSIHWIQDVVLGIDRIGPQSIGGVAILLVWSCAALLGSDRRWGQVLMLLAGFFSVGITVLHLNGRRIAEIAAGDGGFAFLWVLVTGGWTGSLAFVLGILALWRQRKAR